MKLNAFVIITPVIFALSACQSVPVEEANSSGAQPGEQEYAVMIRDSKPPAGPVHQVREGVLSPLEAVVYASQAAPDGFSGTFGMQVRNIGQDSRGVVFLNSELNYREQTNLSVRVDPRVSAYLSRARGDNWVNEIVGQEIEVEGKAQRVVIWFNDSAKGRTDSYYYQTQIFVGHPDHLKIL